MNTIVVTPGSAYADIDGLACAIAYAELLRYEGENAIAVCSGPLNATVPDFLRTLAHSYSDKEISGDAYVIVDTSDKNFLELSLSLEKVIAVFDHHFGFEEFWRQRLGENSKIEPIGAAATLIWEEWKKRKSENEISEESATLLAHAILSNTVNFQLALTNERDKQALQELEGFLHLKSGWKDYYFMEQQKYIERDPSLAIKEDMKNMSSFAFGQLELWDSSHFLSKYNPNEIFTSLGHRDWILNIVDISLGTSVIASNQEHFLHKIASDAGVTITGNTIFLPRLKLRKELLKIINL